LLYSRVGAGAGASSKFLPEATLARALCSPANSAQWSSHFYKRYRPVRALILKNLNMKMMPKLKITMIWKNIVLISYPINMNLVILTFQLTVYLA
jgi:hypothetical protein